MDNKEVIKAATLIKLGYVPKKVTKYAVIFYPHPSNPKSVTIIAKIARSFIHKKKGVWDIYIKSSRKDNISRMGNYIKFYGSGYARSPIYRYNLEYIGNFVYDKEGAIKMAEKLAIEWGKKYLDIFGETIKEKYNS